LANQKDRALIPVNPKTDIAHDPIHEPGLVLYPKQVIIFGMKTQTPQKVESKEGIEALFLYATEGILVVNEKGSIVSINPSAERLFGYEKGELLGQKVEVLVPGRFGRHGQHRDKFNESPHPRSMGLGMELYGLKKDKSEFPVEISLSPYSTDQGKFTIGFIVDITHRKAAEEKMKHYSQELELQVKNRTLILEEAIEELEKTKRNLDEALAKERELSELKSRFVSMASHEFRTPLATIQSSLSLVKKYGDMRDIEKQDKHIGRIKSSINNLTDILNDFLSVSKLEEGKVQNIVAKFNLKEFLNEITSEMQPLSRQGQKIAYTHSGEEIVELDQKLLRHIMFNLISNAMKFSGENQEIEIQSEVAPNMILLRVKDKGIGISKADQEHLFERFFRGLNASYIQGTGLGLNIVARYVELMNGTITVDSAENQGTTFTLTFPL
jgi:PAS domain S-box-containing protein